MERLARFAFAVSVACSSVNASAFTVNYEVVHCGCGNATGSIMLYPVGATPPINYNWITAPPNGNQFPIATGLTPGTWTVQVTDALTTVSLNIDVLALPGLDVANAINHSGVLLRPCPGQCNGQFILNENYLGGQAPYVISTNPPMSLNALCGNVPFDIIVTDALGCIGTATTLIPEQEYPVLLGTILNGSCPGAPTSVEAFFDPQDQSGFSLTSPGGAPAPFTLGPHGGWAVGFPQPYGTYMYTYASSPPCSSQGYPVIYPNAIVSCSDVDGFVFVDVNGNCVNDAGDFPLVHGLVTVNPGGYTALTDAIGHYQLQVPDGTYDLTYTDPYYSQTCPVASPVNFTVDAITPTATIDLPLTPGADPDVAVGCAFGQAVIGFPQHCWVTVTNNSAVPTGPITVTLDHDPLLTYCYSWICIVPPGPPVVLPYPTSYTSGQLVWDLPDGLDPMEQRTLQAQLCVPPDPLLLGTNFNYTATATTVLNDFDPANNVCTHSEPVVGAFDPNDKQARTSSGSSSSWWPGQDSTIAYTIRFQNTGTFTATTVRLVDTLSTMLDLTTLEILGASHQFSASLNDRVLTFTFDHIMLPDSGTNETGSHGFAQFLIRPVPGLAPGGTIANAADIFFDFNPPVRTNTSELFVEFSTDLTTVPIEGSLIYPNPVVNEVRFARPLVAGTIVELTAMDGRCVLRASNVTDRIDLGGLSSGAYLLKWTEPTGRRYQQRIVKR